MRSLLDKSQHQQNQRKTCAVALQKEALLWVVESRFPDLSQYFVVFCVLDIKKTPRKRCFT